MLRQRRAIITVLALITILIFTACTDNSEKTENKNMETKNLKYPLMIEDSYGRKVTINKEPMRVISIAPNITETIFALGQGEKLVGRTDYCEYPEAAKEIESIGSLQSPNIEKILSLNPDLVIASTHFKKDVLEKLEELDLKVIVLYGEESFQGVYQVIEKLGRVLNAKEKADEVIDNMKQKVTHIVNTVKDAERPEVYYVVGFGQSGDYTAGKGTFISEMIKMAGGKNAADDVKGWKYSLERLVEKDPDILICSKGYSPKEKVILANGYKDLTAVKNGKIFDIDNDLLEIQGPRLADGLERLAKIIHPELFR
ncbi:MAG: cobalamin transport system substrate-binding protein [Candidatus Petromonas sp.]|nr:cobalamin transport system substrate-binding protein [Candidatus Petromonas sp.]